MTKLSPGLKAAASLMLAAVLIVIIVLMIVFPPSSWVPAAQWGEWLEAKGIVGIAAFIACGALATSMGFPRQMVAFIGGVAYGVSTGLMLSLIAAIIGCCLTVIVSRRYFAGWVSKRYPKAIHQLQSLLNKDVFLKILILRLQPLGTNLLTNTCIGFTNVSLRLFLAASAIGYVPQMLVFNLLGSGVRVGSQAQLVLSGALLLLSILLGLFLFKKHRREQSVE